MTPSVPDKSDLLGMLRSSADRVVRALAELPPEGLEDGRYENGWNGRQILAHIASIEWTYPRLIDLARSPGQERAASTPAQRSATDAQIGSYNDRQIAKRDGASVAELLAEFQRNRDATIAAIEATDDELLAVSIRSAGGIEGQLGTVVRLVAVDHVLGHLKDITGE